MGRRHTTSVSSGLLGPRLVFMLCVLALVLIGLVMVYSTTSVSAISEGRTAWVYIVKQLIYVGVGVALALFVYRAIPHYAWCGRFVWIAWGVCMVMLLLVPLIGIEIYGAKRWLGVGELTIQPSEFAKIALLLLTAKIIADMRAGDIESKAALIQVFVCVVLPALFLFVTQSDLGTTAIIAVGILSVLWFGDIDLRIVIAIMVLGIAFVVFSIVGTDYRSGRLVYLDPWNDGQGGYGDGYNIIRSYFAIAEGGIFGVGLGNSHEKYQYLFASESDFIYAIIGEELGLIGAFAVVLLFLALLVTGLIIAQGASDDLGRMIAGACTIMIVFQAFLNMGCVIGLFPTTGKPLPFVSAGGSSMMSSMIIVGLILSVSKSNDAQRDYDRRREDLRVIRAEDPYRGDSYGAYSAPYPASRASYPASNSAPARGSRSDNPFAVYSRSSGALDHNAVPLVDNRRRSDSARYPRR
ncbi:MAG: cell division protein FtsW [Eggerthellaceae bacterium]|nr:cell division protein FtsW [Eggerthellaceae bacterium]